MTCPQAAQLFHLPETWRADATLFGNHQDQDLSRVLDAYPWNMKAQFRIHPRWYQTILLQLLTLRHKSVYKQWQWSWRYSELRCWMGTTS